MRLLGLARARPNLRRTPMDMTRSEVRQLRFDEYSATKHLEHATKQAHQRNYQDFLIVDVDDEEVLVVALVRLLGRVLEMLCRRILVETQLTHFRAGHVHGRSP